VNHNSKVILLATLATLIICLIVAIVLVGCGGTSASYVVGVYNLAGVYIGPPSPLMPSGVGTPLPAQRLQLTADGTYEHTTYIPNPLSKTAPSGSVILPLAPTYKGTFTVKGKQVVLYGEPPEAYGTFKIVGINLSNHWGQWVGHGDETQ